MDEGSTGGALNVEINFDNILDEPIYGKAIRSDIDIRQMTTESSNECLAWCRRKYANADYKLIKLARRSFLTSDEDAEKIQLEELQRNLQHDMLLIERHRTRFLFLNPQMAGQNASQIFNHEELEAEMQRVKDEKVSFEGSILKKSKHSLDSDEEDEEETAKKYNVLDPNELEGQEERTIDYDDGIKITPFNMKEELEEGYFDKDGTYIFSKESEEIKDQWLDNIDWVKIKSTDINKRKQSDTDSDDDLPSLNVADHYKQMIELMKPGETVQKAICRLGGSKSSSRSASNRWKRKKDKEENVDESTDAENHEKLQLLTRLADDIIGSGNMDIYQQTYEKLSFHLNLSSNGNKSGPSDISDSGLDMFGDEFEEKVDETKPPREAARTPSPTSGTNNADDEVMWEFKWEDIEDAKIYGPFPTSQMLQWVKEKYFENGVYVRQCNKADASFYSSKRIDFDLYL